MSARWSISIAIQNDAVVHEMLSNDEPESMGDRRRPRRSVMA